MGTTPAPPPRRPKSQEPIKCSHCNMINFARFDCAFCGAPLPEPPKPEPAPQYKLFPNARNYASVSDTGGGNIEALYSTGEPLFIGVDWAKEYAEQHNDARAGAIKAGGQSLKEFGISADKATEEIRKLNAALSNVKATDKKYRRRRFRKWFKKWRLPLLSFSYLIIKVLLDYYNIF